MSKKRDIWLAAGYEELARFGPESISIDRLSAAVGKSRSSFYHLFGDMQLYKQALCSYHWDVSKQMAMELDNAESFHPDFARLIAANKNWAFAHTQMFHHRGKDQKYLKYFQDVSAMIEPKIGNLWIKSVGLTELPKSRTIELYRIIRETMFASMDYDRFTPEGFDIAVKKLNASISFTFANPGVD